MLADSLRRFSFTEMSVHDLISYEAWIPKETRKRGERSMETMESSNTQERIHSSSVLESASKTSVEKELLGGCYSSWVDKAWREHTFSSHASFL